MNTVCLMLIDSNASESEMLRKSFGLFPIDVISSGPAFSNYVKTLQYIPDAVLLEIPERYYEQLNFIQMIKQQESATKIPIIAFGGPLDPAVQSALLNIGIQRYLERPFNFEDMQKSLIAVIGSKIRQLFQRVVPKEVRKEQDVERLLSPQVAPSVKLDIMSDHIGGLMAFPFVVMEVVRLANNEKTSAGDLAKAIQSDPVISANLLKVANSVLFSGSGRTITSIKDAVVRIGFRETRRVVMSMAVMDLFSSTQKNMGFNRLQFWYHCIATAVITEQIASQSGASKPDEAFLVGMLRNFGTILLDEFFPGVFSFLLKKTTDAGTSFIAAERAVLGVTHHELVNRLFSAWSIPERIRDGVTNPISIFDPPERSDTAAFETPGSDYAVTAMIAECIAKAWRFGTATDQFVTPVPQWIFDRVNITRSIDASLKNRIINELNSFSATLKVGKYDESDSRTEESGRTPLCIGVVDSMANAFVPWKEYLPSQGNTIVSISPGEPLPDRLSGEERCDVILVSAGDAGDPAQLRTLLQSFEKLETGSKRQVPVLLIVDKSFVKGSQREFGNLSAMYNRFDLRALDLSIGSLHFGNRVGINILEDPVCAQKKTEVSGELRKKYSTALAGIEFMQKACGESASDSKSIQTAVQIIQAAEVLAGQAKFTEAIAMLTTASEYYNSAMMTGS